MLGVAFGWGIPMAFAARDRCGALPGMVAGADQRVYAVIYDTLYAMVDREDDIRIGVKSTAILFGRLRRPMLSC